MPIDGVFQNGFELSKTAQKFFKGKEIGQLNIQPNVQPTPLPKLDPPSATKQIVRRSEAQVVPETPREDREINSNTQALIQSRAKERRESGDSGIIGVNIDIKA